MNVLDHIALGFADEHEKIAGFGTGALKAGIALAVPAGVAAYGLGRGTVAGHEEARKKQQKEQRRAQARSLISGGSDY